MSGDHMTQSNSQKPIRAVREDMTVIAADGEEIGSVALVKMSDPGAVTAESQEPESDAAIPGVLPVAPAAGAGGMGGTGGMSGAAPAGILATGAAGAAEPDVPPALAA
jgi:hypothetical protein